MQVALVLVLIKEGNMCVRKCKCVYVFFFLCDLLLGKSTARKQKVNEKHGIVSSVTENHSKSEERNRYECLLIVLLIEGLFYCMCYRNSSFKFYRYVN